MVAPPTVASILIVAFFSSFFLLVPPLLFYLFGSGFVRVSMCLWVSEFFLLSSPSDCVCYVWWFCFEWKRACWDEGGKMCTVFHLKPLLLRTNNHHYRHHHRHQASWKNGFLFRCRCLWCTHTHIEIDVIWLKASFANEPPKWKWYMCWLCHVGIHKTLKRCYVPSFPHFLWLFFSLATYCAKATVYKYELSLFFLLSKYKTHTNT